jgi:dihydrodipicolinate synthase/N-acetylneuraminate lyase
MVPLLVIAAVLGATGVLVIALRDRLAKLYDRVDMPAEDRDRYEKLVLPLGGWLMVAAGIFLGVVALLGMTAPALVQRLVENAAVGRLESLLGIAFIALGILNALSHVTGKPRPMKLGAMMARFGRTPGRIVHLVGYTLVPFVLGIALLSEP